MARPWKWWAAGLLAVAGSAVLGSCVLQWPLSVGDAAPTLDVQWLQGEPVDPQRPGDQIVVVEAWATWCGPCLGSIPELDAVQRRYAGRGVRVVAVAVMDDLAEVQKFVARRGRSLSYAIAFDHDGQVKKRWRTWWTGYYVPCTFVVDRTGHVEAITSPRGLDMVLRRMLRPREPREDAAVARLAERYWAAREADDVPAAAAIAVEATEQLPTRAFGWGWRMQVTPPGAARDAIAQRGFAAVHSDAEQVAHLVQSADELQCLPAIAGDAHAALAGTSWHDDAFAIAVARLHAAQVVGGEPFAAAVDAASPALATRPADLVELARALIEPRWSDDGAALAPPAGTAAAALQLVEAALPGFAPWHAVTLHYRLLVETGADAARLDAAGRRAVEALRGSASELNSFAWDLLTDERHLAATRAIALLAAEAMAATPLGDRPNQLDTLALAQFVNGDVAGAIATQERAIAGLRAPDADFTARLERYRRAQAAAAEAPR
ncbi:MAG: TlpA family protein disulfide reductase [Planctomycetes bacterium]|nr:TlpA family protein disulfide reductase [Planctomycetota bacterium]